MEASFEQLSLQTADNDYNTAIAIANNNYNNAVTQARNTEAGCLAGASAAYAALMAGCAVLAIATWWLGGSGGYACALAASAAFAGAVATCAAIAAVSVANAGTQLNTDKQNAELARQGVPRLGTDSHQHGAHSRTIRIPAVLRAPLQLLTICSS